MKPMSKFEYFCLSRFSQPSEDRLIYKIICKRKYRSIMEIGLGVGTRAEKMIRVAQKYGASSSVRYTGIDLFEGRENGQDQLSLRQMHKRLSRQEAKVQLVPGDLHSALSRVANSHVRTDLILISASENEQSLTPSWFYFPRMLHAGSTFMIQSELGGAFKTMNRLEIEKLADKHTPKRESKAA